MIKIEVRKDIISIKGHSLYDETGKDIVCASVSSMVITTINALIKLNCNIDYINNDGIEIKILEHSKITDTLINNLIDLLSELESQYPKNIKIRRC